MTQLMITDNRELDFNQLLAELQEFIGRRIVIESVDGAGRVYHRSEGVLEQTIDNQLDIRSSPERAPMIAFHLDAGACFVLRKFELARTLTYVLGDEIDLESRVIKVACADDATLVIRDDWEQELLERIERREAA